MCKKNNVFYVVRVSEKFCKFAKLWPVAEFVTNPSDPGHQSFFKEFQEGRPSSVNQKNFSVRYKADSPLLSRGESFFPLMILITFMTV